MSLAGSHVGRNRSPLTSSAPERQNGSIHTVGNPRAWGMFETEVSESPESQRSRNSRRRWWGREPMGPQGIAHQLPFVAWFPTLGRFPCVGLSNLAWCRTDCGEFLGLTSANFGSNPTFLGPTSADLAMILPDVGQVRPTLADLWRYFADSGPIRAVIGQGRSSLPQFRPNPSQIRSTPMRQIWPTPSQTSAKVATTWAESESSSAELCQIVPN